MSAYYNKIIENFVTDSTDSIVGVLSSQYSNDGFINLINKQIKAWKIQIEILKDCFKNLEYYDQIKSKWSIAFEYTIPMIGQRIDTVILTNDKILVIEFKIGLKEYLSHDKWQLYNYVMDLKDFHYESRNKTIVPILLASESEENLTLQNFESIEMILCGKKELSNALAFGLSEYKEIKFSHSNWINSNFLPTPDIIKSAQLLYSGQEVEDILSKITASETLIETTNTIIRIFNNSKMNGENSICFVTGVPGAGKTLVGLNIIHSKDIVGEGEFNGSFITGNVPLVLLLREALARDSIKRNPSQNIGDARRIVSAYLHKVHLFINSYKDKIPKDNLIVFDEAQRAWDEKMALSNDLEHSEPHTILEIMSQKKGCLIVALVGEGQEIHKGEAGIKEWLRVLDKHFRDWNVYLSDQLKEKIEIEKISNLKIDNRLHLSVAVRSIRSTKLAEWVESVLELDSSIAFEIKSKYLDRYPIFLTRSIEKAKNFLKYEKNDLERNGRYGIIASSGARRLRPYGIMVQESPKVEEWFLNPINDVRSSNFLELAMTEFSIQGLELDWTCVCWDADLRVKDNEWKYFEFKGTKWNKIGISEAAEIRKQYLLNKYRVLLTRARVGMIIFIPEGSNEDETRNSEHYDETYEYLKSCGIEVL
jgi:hypothetical protein